MPRSKKQQAPTEELDAIGAQLIRGASMNDDESDLAVSDAFLFQRVRARIEAERARMTEPEIRWLATMAAGMRAIPAMGLVAAVAIGFFWFSGKNNVDRDNRAARLPRIGDDLTAPVSACGISSKSECVVSIEEVLAMMMDRSERGTGR